MPNDNNQSPTFVEETLPPMPQLSQQPTVDSQPPATTKNIKKFAGGKVIATILGLFLLVGAVSAGVILVKQNQDIREKAGIYSNYCGGQTDGCKYYDCSQKIDCPSGNLVLGFCNNTYPESDPCRIKTSPSDPQPPSCTAQGYSCTKDSQCCSNYCDPKLQRCGSTNEPNANFATQCTGTDTSIPDHTDSVCELVNGQMQKCTHYICDWGFSCNLCNGKSGNPEGQCPNGYYCIPGGYCIRNGACKYQNPTCTPDPSCTTTTTSSTASCTDIKAYTEGWVLISQASLSSLRTGDKVNFCVTGTTTGGNFDKARFTINGTALPETTTKRPGSEDYCSLYTIPTGTITFNVTSQIHHVTLGWR